ncbi:amidohydrolase [Sphingosinicella sp. CPCC 101087]|uniref:amidohydrolase family protein n=1 Tax=Sphingosinicella sp. CPCC 101087 TaxID=2497754 RepID=UPI00101D0A83|nr:amidohydrolase family protein [Sphingosinicella sp. CPCC 101087]
MNRRHFVAALTAGGLISHGAAFAAPLHPARRAPNDARPRLFDAHIHFFTNDQARYPMDMRNSREPEEIMRRRVMRDPGTPERVFPLWRENGVQAGAGVQYNGAYKADNRYVLDLADSYPDLIAAEIIVNARDPDAPAVVEAAVRERRVSALRLTGFADEAGAYPWLDSGHALRIWRLAERTGLPVGITYLPPRPAAAAFRSIAGLATRFPGATIIFEHLGWTDPDGQDGLSSLHAALRPFANVLFKWTSINIGQLVETGFSTSAFLRRAVDLFGADRLMWGSDFGNTLRPYEGMVADAIGATAGLSAAERNQVLYETGALVFSRARVDA